MTHQMARSGCTLGFRALATAAGPQPVHCSTSFSQESTCLEETCTALSAIETSRLQALKSYWDILPFFQTSEEQTRYPALFAVYHSSITKKSERSTGGFHPPSPQTSPDKFASLPDLPSPLATSHAIPAVILLQKLS